MNLNSQGIIDTVQLARNATQDALKNSIPSQAASKLRRALRHLDEAAALAKDVEAQDEPTLYVFEEWRLTDEGSHAFVALECSIDMEKIMKHMAEQAEDGARPKQVDDPFFGACFVMAKGGRVLCRVRELARLS